MSANPVLTVTNGAGPIAFALGPQQAHVLNWTHDGLDLTNFIIEECSGAGCTNFTTLATVASGLRTYTTPQRLEHTTYRYRVIANGAIDGISNVMSITTGGTVSHQFFSGTWSDPGGEMPPLSWHDSYNIVYSLPLDFDIPDGTVIMAVRFYACGGNFSPGSVGQAYAWYGIPASRMPVYERGVCTGYQGGGGTGPGLGQNAIVCKDPHVWASTWNMGCNPPPVGGTGPGLGQGGFISIDPATGLRYTKANLLSYVYGWTTYTENNGSMFNLSYREARMTSFGLYVDYAWPGEGEDVEQPPLTAQENNAIDCPCPCTCPGGPAGLGPVHMPEETEPLPEWVRRCGFGGVMPDGNDTEFPESWL